MYCNLNFLHFQLLRKEREEEDEFEWNIALPALLHCPSLMFLCYKLLRYY